MRSWFSRNRQAVLRGFGSLVAVGLAGALLQQRGWNELLAALESLTWQDLIAPVLLIVASRLLVSLRWYILLRSAGLVLSFPQAIGLTFAGLFANNFLPTTIGGDVFRLAGAMHLGFDRAVALASLAADRLAGVVGSVFTLPWPLVLQWLRVGWSAGGLGASALAARMLEFGQATARTLSIWIRKPRIILAALACTWGHLFCTALALQLLLLSLHQQVSLLGVLGLWSVAYFVTLVPISVNGYGVQELSLGFLFSTFGAVSVGASSTTAILIRGLYMLVSLGGAYFLPGILAASTVTGGESKS